MEGAHFRESKSFGCILDGAVRSRQRVAGGLHSALVDQATKTDTLCVETSPQEAGGRAEPSGHHSDVDQVQLSRIGERQSYAIYERGWSWHLLKQAVGGKR